MLSKLTEISFLLYLVGLSVQLIFWTFLLKIKTKPINSTTSNKKVSVVVCVHNEEEHITNLIEALLHQSYKNYDILIVDDRSNDSTPLLLEKYKNKIHLIRIESTPTNWDHKKYALKKALEQTSSEFILLTDGDCLPKDKNWIKNMMFQADQKKSF